MQCAFYYRLKKWKKKNKSETGEDQITMHRDGEAQGGEWDLLSERQRQQAAQ